MPDTTLATIRNFIQLTPSIGTAGQPMVSQFETIANAGYQAVINIAMPDHEASLDHEGALVTSLGMHYYHIPVPFQSPTVELLQQFCRLMQALDSYKVFVHYIMNYRVSAFMFQYLHKVVGYDVVQARSPIFDQWEIEPQWQAIVDLKAEDLDFY